MASVTPGYSFTGTTDPITYSKLNLLGQPTVAVGAGEVGTAQIAGGVTITNPTLDAGTITNGITVSSGAVTLGTSSPLIGSGVTETFSGTIALTDGSTKPNTRLINCTSSTAATITFTGVPAAGTKLHIIFTTDGTASNLITFSTGFKVTGTYALNSASKYYVINFVSNGTYWVESGRSGPSG